MGKQIVSSTNGSIPFTIENVKNKELVIRMLNYEEKLTKSDYGQSLYKNTLNNPLISLTIEYGINRLVLSNFGFDTTDESVNGPRGLSIIFIIDIIIF